MDTPNHISRRGVSGYAALTVAKGADVRVRWIKQKPYAKPDAGLSDPSGADAGTAPSSGLAPANIKDIVAFIQGLAPDLPIPAEPAEPLLQPFALNHLDHARALADDALPRPDEVARVREPARTAPTRRLLLQGPSGGGKSVLLAQLALDLGERAIYFSMDQVPEPEPEIEPPRPALPVAPGAPLSGLGGTAGTPALAALAAPVLSLGDGGPDQRPNMTLAVPVRMHLLANLCRLADRPAPTLKLTESEVQAQVRALLAELAARGEAPVWVLIDALNQCDEPAALLAGLPRDLPTNLHLIASTQPVATVVAAVDEAGRKPWRQIALAELDRALTAELALFDWPAADRARLTGPLPDDLLDELKDTAVGLPLLVREWGRDLYQRWLGQGPAAFAAFRRALADADRNQMPPAYRRRLDQARAGFDPLALPDLLLWALALLARPLDLARLYRAAAALRPHFPGTRELTKADCQAALARLGGFLATGGPPTDPRWRALHPRLGAWFVDLHGSPERNFALREALVPLGAGPDLDESRSLAAWAGRVLDGEAVFYDLNAALRLELVDRLLAGLPDGAAPLPELVPYAHRRAGLAARRAWELHETGDKEGAAGAAEGARVLAERLIAPGSAEQQPDLCQDLAVAWASVGAIAWHSDDRDRALAAFQLSLRLREEIRDRFPAAWTWRRRLGLADVYCNLGINLGGLARHEEAIGAYDCAVEHLAALDQLEREVRQALGNAHHGRGVALANLERYDEALGAYDRAIGLCETLNQDQPTVGASLRNARHHREIASNRLKRFSKTQTVCL